MTTKKVTTKKTAAKKTAKPKVQVQVSSNRGYLHFQIGLGKGNYTPDTNIKPMPKKSNFKGLTLVKSFAGTGTEYAVIPNSALKNPAPFTKKHGFSLKTVIPAAKAWAKEHGATL